MELVRQMACQPLTTADDDDALTGSVAALQRLATMVEAEKLRRIAELDRRAAHLGRARSTADLLTARCQLPPGEALQATRLAEDLSELPATAARLADGAISLAHAREAARSLQQLRRDVADGAAPIDTLDSGAARIDAHTAGLAAPFPGGDVPSVSRLRRDLAALTTTDTSLAARERHAFTTRRLWIGPAQGPDEAGMVRIDGLLDPLTGTKLRTALAPLARRSGPEDSRSPPQRTCDALAQLCDTRHPADAPPAGTAQPTPATATHAAASAPPARPSVLLLTTPDALQGTADRATRPLHGYGLGPPAAQAPSTATDPSHPPLPSSCAATPTALSSPATATVASSTSAARGASPPTVSAGLSRPETGAASAAPPPPCPARSTTSDPGTPAAAPTSTT